MKAVKLILFLVIPLALQGQQQVKLRAAIDSALKNNFDIRIARNSLEINSIYNTFGEAGGLPSVSITGSGETESNNTYLKSSSGNVTKTFNEPASNLTGGLNANLTLFNGFKVLATKERLDLLEQQSRSFLDQQVQHTIAAVMIKYYDIIRQENYLKIVVKSLEVASKEKETIYQRRNVGLANEGDVLQSQIDVNLITQSIKSQELIINQAKIDLLELLGVKQYFPFIIQDTILIDRTLKLDSVINFLYRNPEYVSAEQEVQINEQIVKEISAQRYPAVKVNTGYSYSLYNTNSGANSVSQSYGPYVGANIQIPIFNGLATKNRQTAAKYGRMNAETEKESLMNGMTANAIRTYQSYITTLQQLEDQQINHILSGKLLNLMLHRFQLNQATILDMKAAQESYEKSGYLLVNLQFAAKVSEIELKLLTFSLGKSGDF